MFYRAAQCDRCGKETRACDCSTTRISFKDRKDDSRVFFDLCDDCLNSIISDISHFGETNPSESDDF